MKLTLSHLHINFHLAVPVMCQFIHFAVASNFPSKRKEPSSHSSQCQSVCSV